MASKALLSSASPVMVSNKASSTPFSVGLVGPRNLSFSFSSPSSISKKPSSRVAMVVRAQQQQQQGSGHFSTNPNPVPVHAPYTTTEDDRWFKVRLDMPGVAAEDVDVKVEGDLLVIKDLGRQLYSPYDTKLTLPPYCLKQNMTAILENGVLQVSVPKVTVPTPTVVHVPIVHVPVKHASM